MPAHGGWLSGPSGRKTGLFIFAGITETNEEIIKILEPPFESKLFIYKCCSKFVTEPFIEFFKEHNMGLIIFANGDKALMYIYNGIFNKVKTIDANLIKSHSKGGSSSARFGRLAVESKHHYCEHVVDYINKYRDIKKCYIFGSKDIKTKILTSKNLITKLYQIDIDFHDFDDKTIRLNEKLFKTLMDKPIQTNDKIFDEIITLLEIDPDFLLFGKNEILENIDNVEFIVAHDNETFENAIILEISSKYYEKLHNYEFIAKLFYKY